MRHRPARTLMTLPQTPQTVLSAAVMALIFNLTPSHSQNASKDITPTCKINLEIMAAALEEAVIDNIRIAQELDTFIARDNALGITLFSPSYSDIQERAIELLRQNADLKKQNQELNSTLEQLIIHLRNTGTANLNILDTLQNIRPKNRPLNHLLGHIHASSSSSSPMQIDIIAQDSSNGWFIANAGWENGLIEGMVYSFENSAGEKGQLRIIETRRHVSALIPQMGGSTPTIGQKLTLQTR